MHAVMNIVPVTSAFLVIDGLYFASNITKIPDGGWFPLLVAAVTFLLLTTWEADAGWSAIAYSRMPCPRTCSFGRRPSASAASPAPRYF